MDEVGVREVAAQGDIGYERARKTRSPGTQDAIDTGGAVSPRVHRNRGAELAARRTKPRRFLRRQEWQKERVTDLALGDNDERRLRRRASRHSASGVRRGSQSWGALLTHGKK